MSRIKMHKTAAPPAPPAGTVEFFFDEVDWRPKATDGDTGQTTDLSRVSPNYLINGGFDFAQRQVPGTLTNVTFTATDRQFGPDLWGVTTATTQVQYQRIDTSAAAETGLDARYYGKFKKITNAAKMMLSQVITGADTVSLTSRQVRLQVKMKRTIAASMTVRFGLAQLTAAGTIDTIPATFVSAFNAAGTDPTLGTNLAYIAPQAGTQENGSIVGNAVNCVLDTIWKRFGAVWTIPTDAKNLIFLIWTDGLPAINDELNVGEAGLYNGSAAQDWLPAPREAELIRCEAFYEKTFQLDIAPAQNAGLLGAVYHPVVIAGAVATSIVGAWRFRTRKYKTPTTVTFYNPSAANAFVRNTTAGSDSTATTSADLSEAGIRFNCTGIAAWAVGAATAVHISAEVKV